MEVYNKSLCQPRELLVEILQEYPEEVEHIFIPSCVVLMRCAGCCNDEMLQCVPTSSHNITMEVSRGWGYFGCFVHLGSQGWECPFFETFIYLGYVICHICAINGQLNTLFSPTCHTTWAHGLLECPSDWLKGPSGWHKYLSCQSKCPCCLLKGCSGVTFGQKSMPYLPPFLIFTPAWVSLSSGSPRGEKLHF